MSKQRWYLGDLKDGSTPKRIYLYDFSWDCEWYWGGGYLGNSQLHCHFDGCFLKALDGWHPLGPFIDKNAPLPSKHHTEEYVIRVDGHPSHLPLSTWLDKPQYDENTFWRIKDLFKQFYSIRDAAAVFHFGGHCTSYGRTVGEIIPEMEEILNLHIKRVIIPEIRKVLDNNKITDETRTLKQKYMEEILNLHIERVIIPEIRKVLDNNKITDETRTLKQKYGE